MRTEQQTKLNVCTTSVTEDEVGAEKHVKDGHHSPRKNRGQCHVSGILYH